MEKENKRSIHETVGIKPIIDKLLEMFVRFFHDSLPIPVITIQENKRNEAMLSNRRSSRNKKYKLCVILISLLLATVYSLSAVERYQNIECFSEEICLYKDTKQKKENTDRILIDESCKEYADLDSQCKFVNIIRSTDFIILHGLVYKGAKNYLGCFNRFIIR